jgi:DNA ligase 1
MLLVDVASTSEAVAGTSGRLAKTALLAECLRRADPDDVPVVVAYLSGELTQRRTGLGYAALRDLPEPAAVSSLTIAEVDAGFTAIAALSGKGSTTARRERFRDLLGRATGTEQRLLAGLVSGELRQGALDGVLTEAVASAAAVPAAEVRRAVTLAGTLTPVAVAVLAEGAEGLKRFRLTVGSPLRPMLAQSAPTLAEALERTGPAAVEWKLDGIRVQLHRDGSDVGVYTRTLDDITERVPELVEAVLAMGARAVVLDGEVIALDGSGRPLPFQRTASRIGRRTDVARARAGTPLSLFCFDCLHIDGSDLVASPAADRFAALAELVPAADRVPRVVTTDASQALEFYDEAVARGYEGVVVKALDAPYEAGRRGAAWVKVKPRHTFDLVVLAAEWGHGRRRGRLSNLHLGARDPGGRFGPPGGFVMLGKTFKGLTDEMLRWQTDALLALADGPTDGWVVTVRPELVVEIAFDGVQTSPRYPAGMALRFARVLHHRADKSAGEADTIESVEAVHRR